MVIKKVEDEIRNLGGIVDDSFSKDTSYVVSNNEEARHWKKNHGSKAGRQPKKMDRYGCNKGNDFNNIE